MKLSSHDESAPATGDLLPELPAMKTLGRLANARPTVVIDTREQTPLPIARLAVVRAGLTTGDYSFCGGETLFAVERKSIGDLVGCCIGDNRARFERELHRLRGFWFKRLLVIGTRDAVLAGDYRSEIRPQAVLNTVLAFSIRYEVAVEWAPTPEAGARLVEDWVWWAAREVVERANNIRRGME